jgi:holliday junction DNA helicase RuvA
VIARLRGVLLEVEGEACVVEVGGPAGGVGYLVRMGARPLSRLPAPGDPVVLQVESRTTEADGVTLYGFPSREERAAFRVLTAIQGVGPKAALSVLDVLPPGELAAAVAREDKAAVARASGVGPKLALRIVTELRGKPLGAGLHAAGPAAAEAAPAPPAPAGAEGEATAALMGLGLAEPLARRAVEAAAARLGPGAALEALIKAALQESAR